MSAAPVPAFTAAPLPAAFRAALRAPVAAGGDDLPFVVRVDPRDGAANVFRDTPVIVTLSHAADPDSVCAALRVEAGGAQVDGDVALSPDGTVLIWTACRGLRAGLVHFVAIDGLRDRRGRPVRPHVSRFVPCDLALADLLPVPDMP